MSVKTGILAAGIGGIGGGVLVGLAGVAGVAIGPLAIPAGIVAGLGLGVVAELSDCKKKLGEKVDGAGKGVWAIGEFIAKPFKNAPILSSAVPLTCVVGFAYKINEGFLPQVLQHCNSEALEVDFPSKAYFLKPCPVQIATTQFLSVTIVSSIAFLVFKTGKYFLITLNDHMQDKKNEAAHQKKIKERERQTELNSKDTQLIDSGTEKMKATIKYNETTLTFINVSKRVYRAQIDLIEKCPDAQVPDPVPSVEDEKPKTEEPKHKSLSIEVIETPPLPKEEEKPLAAEPPSEKVVESVESKRSNKTPLQSPVQGKIKPIKLPPAGKKKWFDPDNSRIIRIFNALKNIKLNCSCPCPPS